MTSLVRVHMNPEEIQYLDLAHKALGSERPNDRKTGLPDYSLLSSLPTNRRFLELAANIKHDLRDGDLNKKNMEYWDKANEEITKFKRYEPKTRSLQKERSEGRLGDTEEALIPDNLAHILDVLRGGPTVNPRTGHKEYFEPGTMLAIAGLGSLIGGLLSMADDEEQEAREEYNRQVMAQYERELDLRGLTMPVPVYNYKRELLKNPISHGPKTSEKQYFGKTTMEEVNPEKKEEKNPFLKMLGYSKGGPVRGASKGQADDIKMNVPEGSFVIDASSVSDLGDGNTKAGFNQLEDLMRKIEKGTRHLRSKKMGQSKGNKVPIRISAGEFKIPATHVTALGRGSNDVGASLLETMVHGIRSDKRSSGGHLPKAAKHPLEYMRGGSCER